MVFGEEGRALEMEMESRGVEGVAVGRSGTEVIRGLELTRASRFFKEHGL